MGCLEVVVQQLGFLLVSQGLGCLYLSDHDTVDYKVCEVLSDYLTSIKNIDSHFLGYSQPQRLCSSSNAFIYTFSRKLYPRVL